LNGSTKERSASVRAGRDEDAVEADRSRWVAGLVRVDAGDAPRVPGDHLGVALGVVGRELPERGRRAVAQHGALAAGLDRGEEPAAHRQAGVADRIDARMDAVQAPAAHAHRDLGLREPAAAQLRERQHAPLTRCLFGDGGVGCSNGGTV
jgi:hypothetical protein